MVLIRIRPLLAKVSEVRFRSTTFIVGGGLRDQYLDRFLEMPFIVIPGCENRTAYDDFMPRKYKDLLAKQKDVPFFGRLGTFPKTVLVAEDDPNDVRLLELAAQQFSSKEIRFHIVRDGEEALSYLRGD